MKISVFTPSHNTRYLAQAYHSLLAQTHSNWEWIVLLNGGAHFIEGDGFPLDERVQVRQAPDDCKGIGALKRHACQLASPGTDVLLELDHDDILYPTALEDVVEAFTKHDVGFVYSDTVRFADDATPVVPYSSDYGWYAPTRIALPGKNRLGWHVRAFDPTPQALARIWYAPDHLRAWRKKTYWAAGGHNAHLPICDDYELLLRTYLKTDFVCIHKPLYGYRVHENTSKEGTPESASIQQSQFMIGNEYRVKIAETWAVREGLALIDLCSGPEPAEGYVGVDKYAEGPRVWKGDLSQVWEMDAGSVGVLRAQDALEHIPDPLHTMNQAWRVLAHGGWFFSDTPSTDGRGAFQDPTHVSYWNSNSFWYYTSQRQRQFVQNTPHFQMWHLDNIFYDDWYKLHNIPYVRAHMSAVKQGPRLPGPYDFNP
jgi:SAM-dependent methyltransferase